MIRSSFFKFFPYLKHILFLLFSTTFALFILQLPALFVHVTPPLLWPFHREFDESADVLVHKILSSARVLSIPPPWTLIGSEPPFQILTGGILGGSGSSKKNIGSSTISHSNSISSGNEVEKTSDLSPYNSAQVAQVVLALTHLPFFSGLFTNSHSDSTIISHTSFRRTRIAKIHICTVASRPNAYIEVLKSSARVFGFTDVVVLGVGDTLLGPGWGTNFGRKLLHLIDFVKSLPEDDLVFFTDAHDVVVMGDAREAVEGYFNGIARALLREKADPACSTTDALKPGGRCFGKQWMKRTDRKEGQNSSFITQQRRFSTDLVHSLQLSPMFEKLFLEGGLFDSPRRIPTVLISGETACMEDFPYDRDLVQGLHFPCLNSGQIAGLAGDIGDFLSSLPWDKNMNDQATVYEMVDVVRKDFQSTLVVVDHEADLFLSMWGVDTENEIVFDARSRRWRDKYSAGSGACFWHWNGWKKSTVFAVNLFTGSRGVETNAALTKALTLGIATGSSLLIFGICLGSCFIIYFRRRITVQKANEA
jgi:hypothetical protein